MTADSTHQPVSLADWLSHVYEPSPGWLSARQRDVLTALAVRFIDAGTGTGCASIKAVAAFVRCGRATVQRAFRWARERSLLARLSRGHRRWDGTLAASEWRLTLPPQLSLTVTLEAAA